VRVISACSIPNSFRLRGLFSLLFSLAFYVLFRFFFFLLPSGERSHPANAVNSFRRFVQRRGETGRFADCSWTVCGINLFASIGSILSTIEEALVE